MKVKTVNGLTLEQLNDLTAKLNKLFEFTDDREKASTAVSEARDRWNTARRQYAELHAQIVAEYGEKNAPVWVEAIHGPRASHVAPLRSEPKEQKDFNV